MLRAASRLRHYSTGFTPVKVPVVTPKPAFSFSKIFFRVALLTGAVYTVGATAALVYEPLYEPYLDYFPGGEAVIDKLDYTWKHKSQIANDIKSFDVKEHYNEIASAVNESAASVGLDNYVDIPLAAGVTAKNVDQKPATDNYIILSNSDKPTTTESVSASTKSSSTTSSSTPIAQIPLISIQSDDANVNTLISSVNSLIAAVNNSKSNDSSKVVEKIQSDISKLSASFNSKDIQAAVNERLTSVQQQFEQEKTSMIAKLTSTAETTKKELHQQHKQTLENEIAELNRALKADFDNQLKSQELSQIENLQSLVTEKLDSERNGKLANLAQLSEKVKSIENLELQLSEIASSYTTYKEIRKSISKIHSIIYSNSPSQTRGQALVDEIKNLKETTSSIENPLIHALIDSLPSTSELLANGGLLTQSQLQTRWSLLAPELRSISLLPENPGILAYAASSVFSKLLWSKSGVATSGSDVESVIARVNQYVQTNQLDFAVEEVAGLKGTARMLADDWVVDATRKLEVQFLIDALSAEVNVSA